ncbi:hypothetical protein FA15DRAFT_320253 [Coprinopsis marcescibilis]|uniref:Uncharacterized protein n=1 Tax=Coprinopsis marcescibilis TaxID=230819 RepID=A0A5C3KZW7_COPMA|nr:hypothetical protein FA15DRAFT_320253 [Coprinopsis marcescibilis]
MKENHLKTSILRPLADPTGILRPGKDALYIENERKKKATGDRGYGPANNVPYPAVTRPSETGAHIHVINNFAGYRQVTALGAASSGCEGYICMKLVWNVLMESAWGIAIALGVPVLWVGGKETES